MAPAHHPALTSRVPILAVVALLLAMLGHALLAASELPDHASVDLLMDPFGSYSAATLPGFAPVEAHLVFPDRLRAIAAPPGSVAIPTCSEGRCTTQPVLDDALSRGAHTARMTFVGHGRTTDVLRPLRRYDPRSVALFLAIYVAAALCLVSVMILVWVVAPSNPAARSFVLMAASGSAFLICFLDYQTTYRLAAFFLVGYGACIVGIVEVAWNFPRPATLSKSWRVARMFFHAQVAGATACSVASTIWNFDASICRQALGGSVALALALLAASNFVRARSAPPRERALLLTARAGLAFVPAAIAVGAVFALIRPNRVLQSFIPLGGLFIPLSIGYAILRQNALDIRVALSRRVLHAPLGLLALTCGLLLWATLSTFPQRSQQIATPAAVVVSSSVVAYLALRRLVDRQLFRAGDQFQPTLTAWTRRFSDHRDPREVLAGLDELVQGSESVGGASVVSPGDLDGEARSQLNMVEQGEVVWLGERHEEQRLLVPMRVMGELQGVLVVRPKSRGGMLSSDDMLLLGAVASLGATALRYHALSVDLERLRRMEAANTGLFAHEVLHEIAKPLLFLRSIIAEGHERPLEQETLREAEVQVRRLERMYGAFRQRRTLDPRREETPFSRVLDEVLPVAHVAARQRSVRVTIDAPEAAAVMADVDTLAVVVGNLLRNAIEASHDGGEVVLRVHSVTGDGSDDPVFGGSGSAMDVLDRGDGVEHEADLFKPFRTTKAEGSGVGLAACARLTRLLGWEIGYRREGDTSLFRVLIPSPDDVRGLA